MNKKSLFFQAPSDFRAWLEKNHDKQEVQWIGFYKVATGKKSIRWEESLEEAICFGWIDGLRKSIDEESYKIRFTPRRPDSHWSRKNIERNTNSESGPIPRPGLFSRIWRPPIPVTPFIG